MLRGVLTVGRPIFPASVPNFCYSPTQPHFHSNKTKLFASLMMALHSICPFRLWLNEKEEINIIDFSADVEKDHGELIKAARYFGRPGFPVDSDQTKLHIENNRISLWSETLHLHSNHGNRPQRSFEPSHSSIWIQSTTQPCTACSFVTSLNSLALKYWLLSSNVGNINLILHHHSLLLHHHNY